MVGDPGDELDLVPVLAGLDAQIFAQFITFIFDAEFDLPGVARDDADGAVVSLHPDAGPAGDGEGLGEVLGAGAGNRRGQKNGAGDAQADRRRQAITDIHRSASEQRVLKIKTKLEGKRFPEGIRRVSGRSRPG